MLNHSASNSDTIWLLIVAHPDDESMFFLPALRNLLTKCCNNDSNNKNNTGSNSNIVRVLCLSNGDYRSISDGPIRTSEMYTACSVIGIKPQYVTIVNQVRLRDGPDEVWNSNVICEIILDYICNILLPSFDAVDAAETPHNDGERDNYGSSSFGKRRTNKSSWKYVQMNNLKQQRQQQSSSDTAFPPPTSATLRHNINILTFDQWGISKHPNHIDVFRGVHYLLHEKCCIKDDENIIRTMLRFALHNDNKIMNDSAVAELNVTVYTLHTISNPIYKYFLWIFLVIVPFLVVWFIQTLRYLIYFLLGGLLLSGGTNKDDDSSRIQSFSRMTQSYTTSNNDDVNGITLQCRIMDPFLVWQAMSAHYSQFVWYRRLSVLFSRYSYINDLHQLTIDTAVVAAPDKDDETDDEFALSLLPPVVIVKEEDGNTSTSTLSILSPIQIHALRIAVLPSTLHHRPWKRIYSLARDGDSFVTFRHRMEEWHGGSSTSCSSTSNSGHQGRHSNQSSTLLVVKTSNGEIIGGYADIPIVPWASTGSNSAAKSCLFKLNIITNTKTASLEVVVDVYGKQESCMLSNKKIIFDSTRRIIAFGGSDSAKPSFDDDAGFGLCLTDNFVRGTTSKCAAYQMNAPLISDPGGIFDVLDVEVWGFVFGEI